MIRWNGHEIKPFVTRFPDNSQQVWNLPHDAHRHLELHEIVWNYESDEELMLIHQLVTYIREHSKHGIHLVMPFMPYGRQDKPVRNDACFGLHAFLQALPRVEKVTTLDCHNPKPISEFFGKLRASGGHFTVFEDLPIDFEGLFAMVPGAYSMLPDRGCAVRLSKKLKDRNVTVYVADKVRNQQTGRIEKIEIQQGTFYPDVSDLQGKDVLVIDDICDGGGTFIMLAEEVLKYKPKTLTLYVTHGIFSKGLDVLKEAGYTSVISTNKDMELERVY